jgi:hypothetical protein
VQQKISTPSVVSILDTVIRSSQAFAYPEVGGIAPLDPWNTVLTKLEPYALEPDTFVAGLRNALTGPNATNPFVTVAKYENRFEMRAFKLVGPIGSGADFEGSTHQVFEDALASLPSEGGWLVVLAGTYTFNETVSLGSHIRLLGVHPAITTLTTSGNFPLFAVGVGSLVDRFTLNGAAITDQPLVVLAGEESTLQRCSLIHVARLGISLVGPRSRVLFSKFSTTNTSATTVAVAFQGCSKRSKPASFMVLLKGQRFSLKVVRVVFLKVFFNDVRRPRL